MYMIEEILKHAQVSHKGHTVCNYVIYITKFIKWTPRMGVGVAVFNF